VNHTVIEDLFYEEDRLAAEGYLRMVQDYCHRPQQLLSDDFWNILASTQWCYDNEQWQMVIDFAICLADFFEQRGYWQEGMLCISRAIEVCDRLNNTSERPQLTFVLGLLYDRQGELTEAEEYYKSSAELARQLGQIGALADALHRMGWVAQSRRGYATAERNYQEAMELRQKQGDTIGVSRSLHQLGMLAHVQGNYPEAKRLYEQSLQLRREQNQPYLMAASLYQLGILATEQHQWVEACSYLKEALDIRGQIHDLSGQVATLLQLGIIAQEQGDYQTAHNYYVKNIGIFNRNNRLQDKVVLIHTSMQLGALALAQNDFEQAKGWFHDSAHRSHLMGDDYREAQALFQLGITHYQQQQYEQALEHCQHSLSLFLHTKDTRRQQAAVLYQLGLIAHDQDQLDQAKDYYQKSLSIQEATNLQPDAAQTHFQLGMLAQIEQEFVEAQHHYELCHPIFQVGGEQFAFYLAQVNHRLGNIAEVFGKRDKARTYYQQALQLYQTLNVPGSESLTESVQVALQRINAGNV